MNIRVYPKRPPRLSLIHPSLDPFYFVTFNTFPRRPILAGPEVHDAFVTFCLNAQAFNIAVGRYVIMPDHIHLFVMLPREGIVVGEWMKALKGTLTKTIKLCGAPTPCWQVGFFDHLMRSGDSYAEKWEYVRMNPVRAGLCATQEDWPYQGEIVPIRF